MFEYNACAPSENMPIFKCNVELCRFVVVVV